MCASSDYALLAWERAQRLGWPVTVSAGIPAVMTRPGRLLLRYCEWVAGGFQSADLRRLLQSGDCAPPHSRRRRPCHPRPILPARDAGPGRPPAAEGPGHLGPRHLRPVAGRACGPLRARTRTTSKTAPTSASGTPARPRRRGRLAAWIDGVLTAIPDPRCRRPGVAPRRVRGGGGVSRAPTPAARAPSTRWLPSPSTPRWRTWRTALGDHRCDLASALGFVRARVESLTVGRDRPRPGALHVSSLADAGYDGRPRVFVVGLQEGGVFPAAVEDAVLLDAERRRSARCCARRPTSSTRRSSRRSLASRPSARRRPRVCLSFSCRDTRAVPRQLPVVDRAAGVPADEGRRRRSPTSTCRSGSASRRRPCRHRRPRR